MFLKPLRVLLGFSGLSCEPLEASWDEIGVVLGLLLGYFDLLLFFWMVWGAKRHPKGGHFGSQNGVKIFEKSRCKFKTEQIASWNLLESIWARFPSRLGVKNLDFSLVFKSFRENPRFWWTWVSKNDLGSKLEQNRAWNRATMESQIDQKEATMDSLMDQEACESPKMGERALTKGT